MKITLNSDQEWGFTINPLNFTQVKILNEIPEGCFFIIKKREYLKEIERTIIRNIYGRVKLGKIEQYDKKQVSDLLSSALGRYILKTNNLPKHVKIDGDLKFTKPVNFVFFVGNYDIFHLKIDSTDLNGKNPKEILDKMIQKSSLNLFKKKRETKWKAEYAKSGVSKCTKCKNYIERGNLRLGEPSYYQEYLSFRWYHESCIDWGRFNQDLITGLEEIKQEDKKRILQKISK